MATKKELDEKIRQIRDKEITQAEYLRFCMENEQLVLDNCKTRRERIIVKNSLKMARKILR